jgi:hypothetical protein
MDKKPPTRKSLHQAAPLSAGITPAEISSCAHRAKSARQHKKVSHRWKPSLCMSLSTPTTGRPPAPLIRRSVQEMQAASHQPQMPTQPVPQAPSQPHRNYGHAKPRRRAPGTGTAAACPSYGTGEHAPSSWTPSPPLRTAPADCVWPRPPPAGHHGHPPTRRDGRRRPTRGHPAALAPTGSHAGWPPPPPRTPPLSSPRTGAPAPRACARGDRGEATALAPSRSGKHVI